MVTRRILGLGAISAAAASLRLPFLAGTSAEASEKRRDRERKPFANVRHIAPVGSGNRSGTDWQNAATLADIDEMIRLAGPGGTVNLLASAGPCTVTDPTGISHARAPG